MLRVSACGVSGGCDRDAQIALGLGRGGGFQGGNNFGQRSDARLQGDKANIGRRHLLQFVKARLGGEQFPALNLGGHSRV